MSYDPNSEKGLDLRATPRARRGGGFWGPWIALAAIILAAAFSWNQWGGMATDPSPTASKLYGQLEDAGARALEAGDREEYWRIVGEQRKVGVLRPYITHSFGEGARPVPFHAK